MSILRWAFFVSKTPFMFGWEKGPFIFNSFAFIVTFFLVDTVDRPTAKAGFIADIVYRKDGHMPHDDDFIAAAKEVDYYGGNLSDDMDSIELLLSK